MKNALFTKDGKWFLIPEWHQTIANALPVANPEICPQNLSAVEEGKFYQWPGTFDTLESLPPKALLILPTAERYDMKTENMTKALEVARTLPCACSDCGMRETESAKKILEFAESLTASGSVAAPKEEPNKPKYAGDDIAYALDNYYKEVASLRQQIAEDKAINSLLAGDDPEVALANEVFKLRQQLKERDELMQEILNETGFPGCNYSISSHWRNRIDSLIKKPQKL